MSETKKLRGVWIAVFIGSVFLLILVPRTFRSERPISEETVRQNWGTNTNSTLTPLHPQPGQ